QHHHAHAELQTCCASGGERHAHQGIGRLSTDALIAGLKQRRPDLDDVSELVPRGWDELQRTIHRFVNVGFSKFVVLPIVEPRTADEWVDHLGIAAGELLPLQT
ncbi:MAG: hypothetical protein EBX95_02050, partial [Acidimicrobiia bacterium]|nr:hypothetical protein [Acidimicrobiia bacterium]